MTGNLDSFAPDAKVIHADIDPAEIGKNRHADVPIVGDCAEVIAELVALLAAEEAAGNTGDFEGWAAFLSGVKQTYPLGYDTPADGSLAPQYVIERLGAIAGPEAIYASGRRSAPDVGRPLRPLRAPATPGSTPAGWARWASPSRRRWAPRSACPTRPCGPSTATAASR